MVDGGFMKFTIRIVSYRGIGPCSLGASHIRRNSYTAQIRAAPPLEMSPSNSKLMLTDEIILNELTAQTPLLHTLPSPLQNTMTRNPESLIPTTTETQTSPLRFPGSESNPPGSPAVRSPHTLTRSGRVIQRPSRYSD